MEGLITARNRAAYRPAVWSQRRAMTARLMLDYVRELTYNQSPGEMICQAEWPDPCPATVTWAAEVVPESVEGIAPWIARNVVAVPAWPLSDVPADNFNDWTCACVIVRWWVAGVAYQVVCDWDQSGLDIPAANRVEVWGMVGVPEGGGLGEKIPIAASISFCGQASRRARCSTPFMVFDPLAAPAGFLLTTTPAWARRYDAFINAVGSGTGPVIQELAAPITAELNRQFLSLSPTTVTAANAPQYIVAPSRILNVKVAEDATSVVFRISWEVGPA